MKVIAKTETISEFLARGGKVTKCPTKHATQKYSTRVRKEVDVKDVDMSALPAALKIAYGIK